MQGVLCYCIQLLYIALAYVYVNMSMNIYACKTPSYSATQVYMCLYIRRVHIITVYPDWSIQMYIHHACMYGLHHRIMFIIIIKLYNTQTLKQKQA